jgi:hypothetical protein
MTVGPIRAPVNRAHRSEWSGSGEKGGGDCCCLLVAGPHWEGRRAGLRLSGKVKVVCSRPGGSSSKLVQAIGSALSIVHAHVFLHSSWWCQRRRARCCVWIHGAGADHTCRAIPSFRLSSFDVVAARIPVRQVRCFFRRRRNERGGGSGGAAARQGFDEVGEGRRAGWMVRRWLLTVG